MGLPRCGRRQFGELSSKRRHVVPLRRGAANVLAEYDCRSRADAAASSPSPMVFLRMLPNQFQRVQRLRNVGLLAFDWCILAMAALSSYELQGRPVVARESRSSSAAVRVAMHVPPSRDFDVRDHVGDECDRRVHGEPLMARQIELTRGHHSGSLSPLRRRRMDGDLRVFALSANRMRLLETCGVWDRCGGACIRVRAHVRLGCARTNATESSSLSFDKRGNRGTESRIHRRRARPAWALLRPARSGRCADGRGSLSLPTRDADASNSAEAMADKTLRSSGGSRRWTESKTRELLGHRKPPA